MFTFEAKTEKGVCSISVAAKEYNDYAKVTMAGDGAAVSFCEKSIALSYGPFGHPVSTDFAPPCDIDCALSYIASRKIEFGDFSFSLVTGNRGTIESPPFIS